VKVLILNPDLPVFPGRAGHEYLQTTGLRRLGHTVGLVSLVHTAEQDEKKQCLSDAGIELYLWTSPDVSRAGDQAPPPAASTVGRWFRTLGRRLLTPLRPSDTHVQDYQFRNIAPAVLEALAARDWDVLVVVQSSCARWLDLLPPFPVNTLVLHDVRALLFERRAASRRHRAARWLDRLEAARYRRFERHYARRYDLTVTVSAADEAWVRRTYQPAAVATVPIPVDAGYFAPTGEAPHAERVIFTGMMDHPPNVDAACFFARDVWPGIRAQVPRAEFWVVGRNPAPDVLALGQLPGVVVTGLVPDIRPYLQSAGVVVVPLRFGSGMRNKILEAWAMDKCVVSTTIGAEGLDYADGRDLVIADDAAALGEQLVRALREPERREALGKAGRRAVVAHDPAAIASGYSRQLTAARSARRRARVRHTLVDLRWMRPGVAGGIENLARSFLAEILAIDRTNEYTLLVPSVSRFEFDVRRNPNVHVVAMDGLRAEWRRTAWRAVGRLRRAVHSDDWRTPDVERLRFANRIGADLALSIPGYIHPDLHPFSNLLVVPDIQHEDCPEFFTVEALNERRRVYRDAIARARHIVAISEFTGRTLVERLDVPPDKVTVARLAADRLFLPGSPARGRGLEVARKYGLPPGGYFLFPGNTWPHKNHAAAIDALGLLGRDGQSAPLLVCTGAPKEAQDRLELRIRAAKLDGRVRFLGYCPAEDLPGLYEQARALLFPSLYEGFGMPVLEAMWCDCPVVCSDGTSLREIAGDAGLLVNPRDPADIASALDRVTRDDSLRQALRERGRQRAAEFSWRRFALTVTAEIERLFESRWA
jgi:glycosyltransferase involved in cell wall biosynthesis